MSFVQRLQNLIKEKHFSELLKGGGLSFIYRISGLIITYIFTLTVTRLCGAGTWGVFTLFYTVAFVTGIVTKLGIDLSLVKYVAHYNSQQKYGLIEIIVRKSSILVLPLLIILTALYFFGAEFIAAPVITTFSSTTGIED